MSLKSETLKANKQQGIISETVKNTTLKWANLKSAVLKQYTTENFNT